MIDEEKVAPRTGRGRRVARGASRARRARRRVRGCRRARSPCRARRRSRRTARVRRRTSRAWLRRRPRCTASSPTISTCRGRSRSCPSASARSTSIACTRISGSSSRSSSRRSSAATCSPGGRVLDPFAGSGTTLVQCLESGYDAVGVDVAAFNCLLMRVKTARYDLVPARDRRSRRARTRSAGRASDRAGTSASGSRPRAAAELLHFRSLVERVRARRRPAGRARAGGPLGAADDSLRPRLPAHAAARAVLVPQAPPRVRAGAGGGEVPRPLPRSTRSSGSRRSSACAARRTCCGRSFTATPATSRSTGAFDAILTSPPYPGLIDYHEQHRYAYELLGLDDRRDRELGAAALGTSRRALEDVRRRASARVLRGQSRIARAGRARDRRRQRSPRPLSRRFSSAAGSGLVDRLERHVNRRTGRRAGEYFESILVCVRET